MGVLDIPKMIAKANEARKKAKAVQAGGKSGSVSVLINGLVEWEMEEIDLEELMKRGSFSEDQRATVEKVSKYLREDFRKAFGDAKKQLEKKMQESVSLDDFKNLLNN